MTLHLGLRDAVRPGESHPPAHPPAAGAGPGDPPHDVRQPPEAGREAINVEVLNVVRRTERTYDLQWRETRFVNGQQAAQARWRALITIKLQPPKTEAELMKNPLGIRIEDVSWTPDAS